MSDFVVKVGEFAGPIELLLNLIEERRLHISQVSLAAVADDFVAYVDQLGESADKNVLANFIWTAATLMLIKSVALLPNLEITPEERGYNVIYSDTDSVFIETKIERIKADLLGHEIQDEINHFYKNYVKNEYARESFLELQFKKQFTSLLIPQVRNKKNQEKETAAKKRYAGLVHKNGKDELVIVGLEAIRGDWTEAAQEF
jgi:chromatin segregation and condensation protein Rec8/ScpA/Scc1 (kleisin family)